MNPKHISIIAIAIAGLFLIFFFFQTEVGKPKYHIGTEKITTINTSQPAPNDTAFNGVFFQPEFANLDVTLPHRVYQQRFDSLKRLKEEFNAINTGGEAEGTFTGYIGVGALAPRSSSRTFEKQQRNFSKATVDSMDKLSSLYASAPTRDSQRIIRKRMDDYVTQRSDEGGDQFENNQKETRKSWQNYLFLKGYHLDENTKFFVQNAKYHLVYLKKDENHQSHYEQKEIPVRFLGDAALIPISQKNYTVLRLIIDNIGWVYLLLFAYFLIGLPIQILINISRGRAFDLKNIKHLQQMSAFLLIIVVIAVAMPYLFHLIYDSIIPSEFIHDSFWTIASPQILPLLAAVVLFTIARAFKRGYDLQQEQELVI